MKIYSVKKKKKQPSKTNTRMKPSIIYGKKIRFRCQISAEKNGTIVKSFIYIFFNLQNIKELKLILKPLHKVRTSFSKAGVSFNAFKNL